MKTKSLSFRGFEPLEKRTMMSIAASGGEFPVNAYTSSYQFDVSAAADGDGDFVLVWSSYEQDGQYSGIFGRRFNASGAPQGGEFQIHTFTTNDQNDAKVAMDADGDFVVVWETDSKDGSGSAICGRLFDAAGVARGNEFQINVYTTNYQEEPTVAMDANGGFVVAWESGDQDGAEYGIYARRYDALGAPLGGEFLVNNVTADDQYDPAIAMDRSGNFVVAFLSDQVNEDGQDIYMRRFNSAGVPLAGQVLVNTYTTEFQYSPAVAMDADGDFVVAWSSYFQDGSYGGIYSQRYNRSGVAQGGETQVHVATINGQEAPSVAMKANGDYIVTWSSRSTGMSKFDILGRSYSAAGVPQTGEFRINTATARDQGDPAVAADPNGNLIVAWESDIAADYYPDIFAQRFTESGDSVAPMMAGAYVNGVQVRPYSVHEAGVQQLVATFSESMNSGSVTNPANWVLTRNGVNITSQIASISYQFNATSNKYEATLSLSAPQLSGNFDLRAKDGIRDASGNALDGDLNGAPGGSMATPFSVMPLRQSSELHVNNYTTNAQNAAAIAMGHNGNYVVTWQSIGQDGQDVGIFARRYDSTGFPLSGEIPVNVYTTSYQTQPTVAMDADGDFVVAWQSFNQSDASYGIFARRFNAAGVPQSGDIHINTFTTGTQSAPSLAMDASGNFVVAWQSDAQENQTLGVYARRFNAAGQPVSAEIPVNTYTPSIQALPAVAMDHDGDFVIAWHSFGQTGDSDYGIFAQRFNAAGVPQGGELHVNELTESTQHSPSVAMDSDGDFVVAWRGNQDGSGASVVARKFNSGGVPQTDDLHVNVFTTGHQVSPMVGMDADGDFVVAWQSQGQDGSLDGVFARTYNTAGSPKGTEFPVNTTTQEFQNRPAVAMDAAGNFAIAWDSLQEGTSPTQTQGIYAKRFGLDKTPTIGAFQRTPDPVTSGGTIQLTASGLFGSTPITNVSFYRESNGVLGLQVGFEGDLLVGSDTAPGTSAASSVVTTGLANGTYIYYAQAMDEAGLVGEPAMKTSTVVGGAPAVTASQFLFDTAPQKLVFTFDTDVSASVSLSDFLVQKTGGPVVTPDAFSYDPAMRTATLTFNTALPDGQYTATALAAGITSAGGTPMAANHQLAFGFLRGDANNDLKVDIMDLGILASNWQQSPRVFSQGDFNYDGAVNIADLGELATRWQMSLAAPGSALKSVTTREAKRMMEELMG